MKKICGRKQKEGYQLPKTIIDESDNQKDPVQITFDLKHINKIDKNKLYWKNACAKIYDVYVSETGDEGSWRQIASISEGKLGITQLKREQSGECC